MLKSNRRIIVLALSAGGKDEQCPSLCYFSAHTEPGHGCFLSCGRPVLPTRPHYLSLYLRAFLLAALSGSVHRNQSTAKQRPRGNTCVPLALPKKHILYLSILQEPCLETNYRSKRWLCLPAFPVKTL